MYRKSFAFSIHDYCIKIKKEKNIKRKYNRYYSKYNNVLKKLYNQSKKKLDYFQIFQQVAVKNKVNLKELIAIEITEGFQNDKILNYISKNYPNIEIKITKMKNIDELVFKKS